MGTLFYSIRFKLTSWYLMIIMIISALFSGYIYLETMKEMENSFRQMRLRWEVRQGILLPRPEEVTFTEELESARTFFVKRLLAVNAVLFVISAVVSYYFADKTITPIEEAHDEQQRFIADASHELRTPLTALKSSIEVALRDKNLTIKEAREILEGSLEEVDGMKELADSLLNLARVPNAAIQLQIEQIDVAELVQKVAKKFSTLAKEKNLEINVTVEPLIVSADETYLEEILVILVDNAIKYTPEKGKITVSSKHTKKSFTLSVSDTGIGIKDSEIEKIFDRFYRADTSRSKVVAGGFGLGLSRAKQLVELHKGKISVTSQLGHGSTFAVSLPISS